MRNITSFTPLIVAKDLVKNYVDGVQTLNILRDVSLLVPQGQSVAIIGSSGSGKSTLLQILAGLDYPTAGKVLINRQDIHAIDDATQSKFRNENLGFVYQFHYLLPEFTALENVAMPLLIGNTEYNSAILKAKNLLLQVGLAARMHFSPAQLSGGERQRVAIARALVNNPLCVFADEPTGNLDNRTAMLVYDLLAELQQTLGLTLVMATHDQKFAAKAEVTYCLQDGRLQLA